MPICLLHSNALSSLSEIGGCQRVCWRKSKAARQGRLQRVVNGGVQMQDSPRVTRDIIRSALRLAPDADTARAFEELGADSWDLIELRAILETEFRLHFPDAEWVSMECPDDIIRAARLTE